MKEYVVKRNRAALVTSVSTAMLGAGWAAGMVGTAFAAQDATLTTTIGAEGAQTPSADTSTGTSASPSLSASAGPSVASPSAAAADPATAATTPAAPAPAPAKPSGTFDGATVKTAYGNYQVQLTVDAGSITKVSMLQSGADDGTSRQIAGSALPTLQQRVLSAQAYNVQGVSGASYTTQGFQVSVKDAMARAGI